MTGCTTEPGAPHGARYDIVTLGEALAVFTAAGVGSVAAASSFALSAGGAELNVAVAAARLGARAAWCGLLSTDSLGGFLQQRMRAADVAVFARPTDAPTGVAVRHRRVSAIDVVDYHRRASVGAALAPEAVPEEVVRTARTVHVTGITPALSRSARAAVFEMVEVATAAGVDVSFDVNYRRALWSPDEAAPVLRDLARKADVIFAGMGEAALLAQVSDSAGLVEASAALHRLGGREVIVRDGARGAGALVDGMTYEQDAAAVILVDAVGAGDGFAAGYLAGRAEGDAPEKRLRQAAMVGAFVAATNGDSEGAPTSAELQLLKSDDDVLR